MGNGWIDGVALFSGTFVLLLVVDRWSRTEFELELLLILCCPRVVKIVIDCATARKKILFRSELVPTHCVALTMPNTNSLH